MTNDKFILDVRIKISKALSITFAKTAEINTRAKAIAALAALVEWEETKARCKRG